MEDYEQHILDAWQRFEEQEPTISTERLFNKVSEHTGRDIDDITTALHKYTKEGI